MKEDSYLIDYHLHTPLSGHAQGELEEYVEKAIKIGLKEIGFSDHAPLPRGFAPRLRDSISIPEKKFSYYVEKILKLRDKFPEIKIKLGCEIDFIPGRMEETLSLIQKYPLDYRMVSIHFVDGFPFDHPAYYPEWERESKEKIFLRYFQLLKEAIQYGEFDIIAHPDLPKKFGDRIPSSLKYLYREIARCSGEKGMVCEINSSGLRRPVREIYPSEDFLRVMKDAGIPVTFGSDAHSPEEVGKDIEKCYLFAISTGYRTFTLWERRNPISYPLHSSL